MAAAGLSWPAQAKSFDDVARLHAIYADIEHTPGYSDMRARMGGVRESLRDELIRGTLDKWGRDRSDEKRAALHVIDTLLAFAPAVHRQYDELLRRKADMEQRAKPLDNIHDTDYVPTGASSWGAPSTR